MAVCFSGVAEAELLGWGVVVVWRKGGGAAELYLAVLCEIDGKSFSFYGEHFSASFYT